jgi:molybdopterin synthase catalytic subunit
LERLPGHLQTRIKEEAAEKWSREQMRLVHMQLLERAVDHKYNMSKEAAATNDAAKQRLAGVQAAVQAQADVINLLDMHGYLMGPGPMSLVLAVQGHVREEYFNAYESDRAAADEFVATFQQQSSLTLSRLVV